MTQPFEARCLAGLAGIRHGFFTRAGGVSGGIYAGLNCGLGSDDERAHVLENRARVARHLGSDRGAVVTVHQVHSATAVFTRDLLPADALPKGDAIVTTTPGLVIGALAADCAPVLFADPEAKVVACAHAGWRGAVGGVVEATIAEMIAAGARRDRIVAAVGPCISQSNYEVGPEFEAELMRLDPANARFFEVPDGAQKSHFDLQGYVSARLGSAGLADHGAIAACTYENESELFSYRRSTHRSEPDYGRQISAIVVA